MMRVLATLTISSVLVAGGCSSQTAPPAALQTGVLQTYRHLEEISPDLWRYIDESGRLARYDKFNVMPVQLSIPDDSPTLRTSLGDIRKAQAYMRQAIIDALSSGYEIVDAPAFDAADIQVWLTDVADSKGHVGISMEGQMLDSESSVQIGAVVQSKRGKNLTMTKFWAEHDAKKIMDAWAARVRQVIDEAHGRDAYQASGTASLRCDDHGPCVDR